jgi:hypothetical protein
MASKRKRKPPNPINGKLGRSFRWFLRWVKRIQKNTVNIVMGINKQGAA